jgi:cysteine desulfurase
MLYLDHNATTPVDPRVKDAALPFLMEEFGNPSSAYALGQRAREAVENARAQTARALGASPGEILFTSGGTESNNTVLKGVPRMKNGRPAHVITTRVEHPAVTNPCLWLLEQGMDVDFLPVDSHGMVDPEDVRRAIRKETVLVSCMHSNNETGTLMPVAEIARLAREEGALSHTDAAQSVGKVPLDVEALGVDFLTAAGHKLYAPKGVGALYIRNGAALAPLLHGAGQEKGRRAGTENVALCVALGAAFRLAASGVAQEAARLRALRDRLHQELQERVPGLSLNGHPEARLPNTLNVAFPGVAGADVLARAKGVCASTGAACHDRSVAVSHVLEAMGLSRERAMGAVRLSLGRHTSEEDITRAADILSAAYRKALGA